MADWLVIQVETLGANPGDPHSPVSGATVCLVPRADVKDAHFPFADLTATHSEGEPGVYRGAQPATPEGEFLLVVRKDGTSPVVQRLRVAFSKSNRGFVAGAGWRTKPQKNPEKPGYTDGAEQGEADELTAATVSLPRYNHSRSANNDPDRLPIKVLLYEATELVFMATADYRNVEEVNTKTKPLDYRLFASGRRNKLYAQRSTPTSLYKVPSKSAKNFDEAAYEKRLNGLNPGSIYTLFWCHDRTKTTMVKSQGGASGSWIVVDSLERPAPSGADPEEKYFNNPKRPRRVVPPGADEFETFGEVHEWSIVDLYKHVSDVGKARPNSVVEVGIFGHGWYAGPLVWSTNDLTPSFTERWEGGMVTRPDGEIVPGRRDLDGRQKDWFLPARDGWPNFADAFHPSGSFRVWGCNHMVNTLQEGRTAFDKLQAKVADDQVFEFPLAIELIGPSGGFFANLGRESATLRHMAKNFEFYFKSVRNEHAIEIGDARGVSAYCGAAAGFLGVPTFGSPPGSGAAYVDNRNMAVEAFGAEKCIRFMKAMFGTAYQESEEGYVDYRRVFDSLAELPDPGWNPRRWLRYRANGRDEAFGADLKTPLVLRIASGLEVFRNPRDFDVDFPDTVLLSTPQFAAFERALALAFPSPRAFELDGEQGQLFRFPKAKASRLEVRTHVGDETWERRALFLGLDVLIDSGLLVTDSGKALLLETPTNQDEWAPAGVAPVQSRWTGSHTRWKVGAPLGGPSAVVERVEPKYYW
jgi:hypothetical protein